MVSENKYIQMHDIDTQRIQIGKAFANRILSWYIMQRVTSLEKIIINWLLTWLYNALQFCNTKKQQNCPQHWTMVNKKFEPHNNNMQDLIPLLRNSDEFPNF